jgi:hypothetical protein
MLFLEPEFSLVVLAFGAVAVFAGVIGVDLFFFTGLVFADVDMAAHILGPAVFDIAHGPQVTGKHLIFIFFPVLLAIAAKDIRHLEHDLCLN